MRPEVGLRTFPLAWVQTYVPSKQRYRNTEVKKMTKAEIDRSRKVIGIPSMKRAEKGKSPKKILTTQ